MQKKFLSFQHVPTILHLHNCHSSTRLYIHSHASKVFWYITVTWMVYYSRTCFNRPISCCKLITTYLYLHVVNLDFTLLHIFIFLSLYQIFQVLRIYYQLLPDWVTNLPDPPFLGVNIKRSDLTYCEMRGWGFPESTDLFDLGEEPLNMLSNPLRPNKTSITVSTAH